MLAALLVGLLLTPGIQPPPESAETRFLALERTLFRGLHEGDAEALDRLLAEDYRLRGSPEVSRAAWLENAARYCWGDRSDIDGFTVSQDGALAVVSFRVVFYEDPLTCRPATLASLVTDVWRLPDGAWRLAARQSGPADAGVTAQFGRVPLPPPAIETDAELTFVGTGGNADTETLGFAGAFVHRGTGTTTGRVSFVRSESDATENARSLQAQARYGRALSPRVEAFGRTEYLRDIFAGIEHRIKADAGVSLTLRGGVHAVHADVALGGTSELRLRAPDEGFANATAGLEYLWKVTPLTEIAAKSSLVADLERGTNWRGASEVSLLAALNGTLSARLSYALRYVHVPVPGFQQADRTVSAALVVRYRRQPR